MHATRLLGSGLLSGLFVASALWVPAAASAQSADVVVTSSAAPTSGLVVGREVLVSTSIRNEGPNPATNVSVSVAGGQQQTFAFDIVGSDTPGCVIESLDFNPPQFNFSWTYPALAIGQQETCQVRLRVRENTGAPVELAAFATSSTSDPVAANNTALLSLSFATSKPRRIPSTSAWSVVLLGVLTLVSAGCLRRGGRQ